VARDTNLAARNVSSGRPYVLLQMFFLFLSPGYLLAPSADRRETLPVNAIWVRFIMQVQKFVGPSPKEIGGQNMQNSARFQTTSDFDREYLRNVTRYPKSERDMFTGDSSSVPRKKSGELWYTNYRELDVRLDPPKLNFSGSYISALRGCWPLKF